MDTILLIVILVLLFGGGGGYYWSRRGRQAPRSGAVVNRQDENLGKIHEVVVDAEDGRQDCVVFSNDSFMGMGSKLFTMPWKAFEFQATENRLLL